MGDAKGCSGGSPAEDPTCTELPSVKVRTTRVRLSEGQVTDVTEVIAVLKQCLCVAPPPELRAKIIWRIQREVRPKE